VHIDVTATKHKNAVVVYSRNKCSTLSTAQLLTNQALDDDKNTALNMVSYLHKQVTQHE